MNATLMQIVMLCLTILCFLQKRLNAQTGLDVDGPIPAAIVAEAKIRNIPFEAIKLRGQQWTGCIANGSQFETCIVLGESRELLQGSNRNMRSTKRLTNLHFGDRLIIERFGQPRHECTISSKLLHAGQPSLLTEIGSLSVEKDSSLTYVLANMREAKVTVVNQDIPQTIDALPRYKRESPQLVRTSDVQLVAKYMHQHPHEPFMVIVTVPSLCEPCRRYEPTVIKSLETGHVNSIVIKTFLLEYFSFQDAQLDVLGAGATFPTTLVFGPSSNSIGLPLPKLTMGRQIAENQIELHRRIEASLGRGVPHAMANGLLSPESLKTLVLSL